MWRTVRFVGQKLSRFSTFENKCIVRCYLSKTFSCEDAWNKRLESPYIKKINVNDIFYEIENQFSHFAKASGLDIDLFANAVNDNTHLDEVEDVIHKLRLSPEAMGLLPSTHHAFIRLMLAYGNIDTILRILDDRLNYGIFMDDYSCILLMNKCLTDGNFKDAAKVATIQMTQEDFSHPIVKYMSLFACHRYILDPVEPWTPVDETETEAKKTEEEDDEEEEIKIRVRYIRNPYFDDHFDLRKPFHLVGKTLWMIGKETPDALGRSYEIIGYALHEKWDKLKNLIDALLKSNDNGVVYKSSVELLSNLLDGPLSKESEGVKDEIKTLLDKLNSSLNQGDLLSAVEQQLKEAIKENERTTIENQIKIYENWEKDRERFVKEQIEQLKREKVLLEIKAAKKELQEKEEELFYFDNEEKIDLQIEKKQFTPIIKWKGKIKTKRVVDSQYIPPEVEKRRTQ